MIIFSDFELQLLYIICIDMVKKVQKKLKKKKTKKKDTLPPGKKKCRNCDQVIPIHRKICLQCGHVHEMKRMKDDIMRNLKKMTPIVIKSIIENDDFNQFKGWKEDKEYNVSILQVLTQGYQKYSFKNWRGFKKSNHKQFQYCFFDNPIVCTSSTRSTMIFIEEIEKIPDRLTENEILTMRAYDLEKFHCLGVNYKGLSLLRILAQNNCIDTIVIERHIEKMKSFSNLVAMQTGEATLLIVSVPIVKVRMNKENLIFRLNKTIQIMEAHPDRICSFEWLKSSAVEQEVSIVVGTVLGHMSVYRIKSGEFYLQRYIPNAHFDMVTSIAQCPLNTEESILFASGCYDGSVSVWNLKQRRKIYSLNTPNRKILSLVWDPGAKFLLIAKDETTQSCIIACFYSINKIETNVHMANCLQIRTVKNSKNKYMVHHDPSSKHIPLLDPVRGNLKFLVLEQLRGKSLKKKKAKEETVQKYVHFSIDENLVKISEEPEEEREEEANTEKKFPIFSDIVNFQKEYEQHTYISCFSGLLIKHIRK